ncbi:MAG: DNA replication/repair protein RecF [Clostridiales bacterium]|nr:DNA replication/repair protein RecF [Clostridiales bacterium]
MHIEKIVLKNFRNYAWAQINPAPTANLLIGQNAQGKTNLVEAVYYLCVGKSPRTPREKELIKHGEQQAYLRIDAVKKTGKVKIEAYLTRTENRRISVNGIPVKKIAELMGTVKAIFFSPDELKIVKEAPADRRRFLDIDLSQLSRSYFYNLTRYNKILSQRNKLLKSKKHLKETVDIWDEQLAECGAQVAYKRQEFVARLARFARKAQSYLTDGQEKLEIEYEGFKGQSPDQIKQTFLGRLKNELDYDIERGYTNAGIHKDDIALTVNGVDIRSFGSQGQQRTAALALKLAELEIFSSLSKESPILILDDVFSELDKIRRLRLMERIKNIQTFITSAHFDEDIKATVFEVKSGQIFRK